MVITELKDLIYPIEGLYDSQLEKIRLNDCATFTAKFYTTDKDSFIKSEKIYNELTNLYVTDEEDLALINSSDLKTIKNGIIKVIFEYSVKDDNFEDEYYDNSIEQFTPFTLAIENNYPSTGGSDIDLSDYYDKEEVDNKLNDKLDISTYEEDKENYYTKTEVDEKIDEAITGGEVDLSSYYKKTEVDELLVDKVDTATYNSDKETFALKTDIPTDYLTTNQANELYQSKGDYLTEIPEEYITDSELSESLSNKVDISTYNSDKANFASKDEIPSLDDYYTKEQVDSKIDEVITGGDIDLSNYYTKTDSDNRYVAKEEGKGLSSNDYTTEEKEKLAGLSNYNDTEIKSSIESIQSELNDKLNTSVYTAEKTSFATKEELSNKLDTSTYTTDKATFALKSELPTDYLTDEDLTDYATKTELSNKQDTLISGTNIKTINSQSLLGEGNIEITVEGGGITDAPIDEKLYGRKNSQWEEIVIPDVSNLASKDDLSTKLDTSTYNSDKSNFALKSEIPSLEGYYTKEEVDDLIENLTIDLGSYDDRIEALENEVSGANQTIIEIKSLI